MKPVCSRFLLLVCIVAACFTPLVSQDQWSTFRSAKFRFEVRYPESWNRVADTADVLNILSFPPSQRVQGVVLPAGGAAITVTSLSALLVQDGIATIEDWIASDVRDSQVLGREITSSSREPGACTQLTEVSWKSEEGPGRYSHTTSLYCRTRGALFRVQLSLWEGESKELELKNIARRMALSLRSQ